jgi:hypothetical protein
MAGPMRTHIAPVLCWAAGDAIRAKLHAEVDRYADDANAVSAAQRTNQLEQIDNELADLGRQEESLLAAMEAAGETVNRRVDVDPEIVLEVREVEDPEPQSNRPEGRHHPGGEHTTVLR